MNADEIELLDSRIMNLNAGILGMAEDGTIQVSKAFLTSIRDYLVDLLERCRSQPANEPLTPIPLSDEELDAAIYAEPTNGDRIRGMSDEELAEFLDANRSQAYKDIRREHRIYYDGTQNGWLEWLRQRPERSGGNATQDY